MHGQKNIKSYYFVWELTLVISKIINTLVPNFFMKTIFSFYSHSRIFAFPIFRKVCSFYAMMFRCILVTKVEQILILSAFVSRMSSVSLRSNASIESP